jgi:hypothetical protein
MAIESLVRKKYFLTSEQNAIYCVCVDKGRQICCTERFLICFKNILRILITKACLIFTLFLTFSFRFQLLGKFMLNVLALLITLKSAKPITRSARNNRTSFVWNCVDPRLVVKTVFLSCVALIL